MARILGGGGKMPSQTAGRPGYRSLQAFGAPRKRVGLVTRATAKTVTRLLRRDPSKYQGDAPFGGPLTRATFTTAMTGTNNDLKFIATQRGAPASTIRVQLLVAGANTPLTVSVSGSDVTVNVATSAGSAATSTAAQVLAALNANANVRAVIETELAPGNDGTGVVTAQAYVTLVGGVVPVIKGSGPRANPESIMVDHNMKSDLAAGRGGKRVVNKGANRSLRKY